MRRAEYRGGREDPGGSCGQVAVPRPAWGQGHYRPPRWWPGAQPVPPGVWSWSAAFRFVLPENREQNPLLPGRPAGPCGPAILRPEEPGSRFWLKLLSEDCALDTGVRRSSCGTGRPCRWPGPCPVPWAPPASQHGGSRRSRAPCRWQAWGSSRGSPALQPDPFP